VHIYTNQPIFNSLEGPIVYDKLMSFSDQVVSHNTNYPSKGNISKSEATNTTLSTMVVGIEGGNQTINQNTKLS